MNIDSEISLLRNGLESAMAHCISQNLNADPTFNVEWYLNECRSFFSSLGIDAYLIEDMIDEAHEQGSIEYAMGMVSQGVDAGAQLHPSANPRYEITGTKLASLLQQLEATK